MAYSAVTDSGGAVTSFLALTTTFTVPSSCSNLFKDEGPSIVAFDPSWGLDIRPQDVCQPRAVTTWWNQGNLGTGGNDRTAVSLGPLLCPQGFSTVASWASDSSSTQAMCCPNSYSLANYQGGSLSGNCQSSLSSGQTIVLAYTAVGSSSPWTVTTTTVPQASYAGAIAIVGWNIKQAANAVSATTTLTSQTQPTSTTSAIPSATVIGSSVPPTSNLNSLAPDTTTASSLAASIISSTTSPATTTTMNDSSDGLTAGAKAGIGVGVAMGFILFVLLGLLIWVIARRKRSRDQESHNQNTSIGAPPPISKDGEAGQYGFSHYSPTNIQPTYNELHGQSQHGELDALRSPVELDGELRSSAPPYSR